MILKKDYSGILTIMFILVGFILAFIGLVWLIK